MTLTKSDHKAFLYTPNIAASQITIVAKTILMQINVPRILSIGLRKDTTGISQIIKMFWQTHSEIMHISNPSCTAQIGPFLFEFCSMYQPSEEACQNISIFMILLCAFTKNQWSTMEQKRNENGV